MIISALFIIALVSCKDHDYLITKQNIGKHFLNSPSENISNDEFEITVDSNKIVISIMVKSERYKTVDGFGVGSSFKDLKSFYKVSTEKEININKGNTVIGSLGNGITLNNIMFVDNNNDRIVDFVWIQVEN